MVLNVSITRVKLKKREPHLKKLNKVNITLFSRNATENRQIYPIIESICILHCKGKISVNVISINFDTIPFFSLSFTHLNFY